MSRRSELPLVRQYITEAGIAGIRFEDLRKKIGCSESCLRKHLATLRKEGWLAEDRVQAGKAGRPISILLDGRFR